MQAFAPALYYAGRGRAHPVFLRWPRLPTHPMAEPQFGYRGPTSRHCRSTAAGAAQQQEQHSGQLRRSLAALLPGLHPAILLPPEDEAEALYLFVHHYIELVPDALDQAARLARSEAVDEVVVPLLQLATNHFLACARQRPESVGLAALLDPAYLAHRLLDEGEGYCLLFNGRHLQERESLQANLIVQQLLGEQFSLDLEAVVDEACRALQQARSRTRPRPGGVRLLRRPCLAARFGLRLYLPGMTPLSGRVLPFPDPAPAPR